MPGFGLKKHHWHFYFLTNKGKDVLVNTTLITVTRFINENFSHDLSFILDMKSEAAEKTTNLKKKTQFV